MSSDDLDLAAIRSRAEVNAVIGKTASQSEARDTLALLDRIEELEAERDGRSAMNSKADDEPTVRVGPNSLTSAGVQAVLDAFTTTKKERDAALAALRSIEAMLGSIVAAIADFEAEKARADRAAEARLARVTHDSTAKAIMTAIGCKPVDEQDECKWCGDGLCGPHPHYTYCETHDEESDLGAPCPVAVKVLAAIRAAAADEQEAGQ